MDKLKFPVLGLKGKDIVFYKNLDEMTICGIKAYKNGYYNSMRIIDSAGKETKIVDTIKIGYAGPLWGLSLMYTQKLKMEFKLSPKVKVWHLDNFISMIVPILKKSWYYQNLNEIPNSFKDFNSIKEIIVFLSDEYYKEYHI